MIRITQGLTSKVVMKERIIAEAPRPVYTLLKTTAAMIIQAVNPERFKVEMEVFLKRSQVSLPFTPAHSNAPEGPDGCGLRWRGNTIEDAVHHGANDNAWE